MDDLSAGRTYSYSDDPSVGDGEASVEEFRDDDDGSHAPYPQPVFKDPETTRTRQRSLVKVITVCVLLVLALVGAILGGVLDQHDGERGPTAGAIAYLEYLEITAADAFADKASPQFKAVEWMMRQDPMKLSVSDKGFVQRYVVTAFVFAVVIPSSNEALLRDEMNFLSGYHECEWQAKWKSPSDNTALFMGIFCDDNQVVNKIILPNVGLTGKVPKELGSLKQLEKIVLDANVLTGAIPYVPSLTSLSLAYNSLDGTMPEYVGLMTNLEELVLTENFISGELPEVIEDLTSLKRFAFGGNELTGGIHNLFHLTSLEEIYGGFNSLKDGFDNDSFGHLTNLRVLDLKNNKLEGPFPDVLWTLPKLQIVDFHFNALDGHLHEIKDKHSPVIEYLDVSENFLGGGLPTTLNKISNLVYLDVSTNRFDKTLPDTFGTLTNLKTLLLTDNSAFGPQPIPSWLQGMTSLEHLSLKLTGRTGKLPDWFFGTMKNLVTLDLDWNHLSGTLASDLGHLTKLEHLILNRNWFEGTIPDSVSKLPHLKTVMLDNNKLVGELVACQATSVIADCGNPQEGCPNCISNTMEVNCPCCTRCCYDADELCNGEDWLSAILESQRSDNPALFYPSNYRPSDYTPTDVFEPKKDDSP